MMVALQLLLLALVPLAMSCWSGYQARRYFLAVRSRLHSMGKHNPYSRWDHLLPLRGRWLAVLCAWPEVLVGAAFALLTALLLYFAGGLGYWVVRAWLQRR